MAFHFESVVVRCYGQLTCATVDCIRGYHCQMFQEECVSAPCDAVPRCVDDTAPTCASVDCITGSHCELVQVECITTPCNPIPTCVDD